MTGVYFSEKKLKQVPNSKKKAAASGTNVSVTTSLVDVFTINSRHGRFLLLKQTHKLIFPQYFTQPQKKWHFSLPCLNGFPFKTARLQQNCDKLGKLSLPQDPPPAADRHLAVACPPETLEKPRLRAQTVGRRLAANNVWCRLRGLSGRAVLSLQQGRHHDAVLAL